MTGRYSTIKKDFQLNFYPVLIIVNIAAHYPTAFKLLNFPLLMHMHIFSSFVKVSEINSVKNIPENQLIFFN